MLLVLSKLHSIAIDEVLFDQPTLHVKVDIAQFDCSIILAGIQPPASSCIELAVLLVPDHEASSHVLASLFGHVRGRLCLNILREVLAQIFVETQLHFFRVLLCFLDLEPFQKVLAAGGFKLGQVFVVSKQLLTDDLTRLGCCRVLRRHHKSNFGNTLFPDGA